MPQSSHPNPSKPWSAMRKASKRPPSLMSKAILCAGILNIYAVASTQTVLASTASIEGKCAFLVDQSYQEKCTALFDDNILTLIPSGSRQVRILPQQIAYISLADKSSMKLNEGLELYNKSVPWWQPWNKVPGWVKNAASEKIENHQFTIGYIDKKFNPKIVLFVVNDKSKAGSMATELQAASGLQLGQRRTVTKGLDAELSNRLVKEAQRQAGRLSSLCSQYMFEDAEPVASALDSYTQNTIEEISVFNGYEDISKKIQNISKSSFSYCDKQIKAEMKEAETAERARVDALRRREAAARAARYAAAAAAAAAETQRRRSAWDSLAGS